MAKTVNIREIARLSGVSTMTVSRVLGDSGQSLVSLPTRQRVLSVAERLKYQPNMHARRIFSKKSRVLGLVLPSAARRPNANIHSPDSTIEATVAGAVEATRERGYYIMTVVADERFLRDRDYLKLLRSRCVDGLLIWGICYDEMYVRELAGETNAVILINTHLGDKSFPRIYSDNAGGSRAVANHLLELGHRNVGYISGSTRSSIGVDRRRGFTDAFASAAGTQVHHIEGDFSFESGRNGALRLLDAHPSITAIACGNDLAALGVMETLDQKGLNVPGEISVAGADALYPYLKPRLTTFSTPLFDIGFQSAKALIDILEDDSPDKPASTSRPNIDLQLKVELVIGGTTARPKERP